MVAPPDNRVVASKADFNRQTMRWIILPMVGVSALVLVGFVIVLLLPERLQVSIIADWLLSVLFLCPMMLCLFPLCIGLIAAIVGLHKAHNAVARPLQRVEMLSATLKDRTTQTAETVSRQTINTSVKFAFIERLLSVFDPPSTPPAESTKEE